MPYNSKFESHIIQFSYPFAGDLLVRSIHGKEKLSSLFEFHVDLTSADGDLDFKKLVGHKVTAKLRLGAESDGDGGFRYFNGYITEFGFLGEESEDTFRYQATLRPWLWLLTRTSDCRIFQNMVVPDIIKEIFKLNNMVDFEVNLKAKYREWDYCVQYNETDFDFISRLMEQEGIYYYFKHQDDKHILVIVDGGGAHSDFPGFAEITYNPGYAKGSVVADSLHYFAASNSIMPNIYALQDYDFENPKAPLLVKYKNMPSGYEWPLDDPEIFDYPGEYVTRDDGNTYAVIRLQELQCQWERMKAEGQCRGLSAGFTFKLVDSPRSAQNQKYLTISIDHHMNNHDAQSGRSDFTGGEESKLVYSCKIEAMVQPSGARNFRAPRTTPKPIVRGPQTAMVVGPASDEIYTDEYGRVKVQFHWDRYGKKDENSSCWVRVSQLWAGTKWGGIHIPRIGQEVVVSFLEGDPDRPLITGSVYNANCMPPYTLAANKTQSGIKSHSTLNGGPDNFNEIRFEDKKDEELLYIQAERDEKIYVKKDKTEIVGENEKIDIYGSRDETVHEFETITVKKDREELVEQDETLEVRQNRVRKVGENETITVGNARSHTVEGDETIKIAKNQDISVGKQQSIEVNEDRNLVIKGGYTVDVKKAETRDVGKQLVITAGTSILLKCGAASISLKKNGEIKIDGKNIIINGSGKIVAKASGDIVLKGSKVLEN